MPFFDRETLNSNDRTWLSKLVLRILLTVLCLVAIGLLAYELAKTIALSNESYGEDYGIGVVNAGDGWILIPLGLSVIWAFISIPILLIRKKPVHPGFNVAFDLLLTLALAISEAVLGINSAWNEPDLYNNDYSEYGDASSQAQGAINNSPQQPYQYTYSNGTQVTRNPGGVNYLCPNFDSCAQQNAVQSIIGRLNTIERVAAGFVGLAFLVQFALFVWACVDTHRYNTSKAYEGRAQAIAQEMIREMRVRGELPPLSPTGQAVPLWGPTAYPGPGGYYQPAPMQGAQPYQPHSQTAPAQGYSSVPQQEYGSQEDQRSTQTPMEFYGHPAFRGEPGTQGVVHHRTNSPSNMMSPQNESQHTPMRIRDDVELPEVAPHAHSDSST